MVGVTVRFRSTAVCRNGGFSAFLETFVLVESSGIFSNFGAERPPLLQAAKRCKKPFELPRPKIG